MPLVILPPLFLPSPQRHPSKLSTPEYTVELKGASLDWAPKDKSSKKNVLEVSGGIGGEGPLNPTADRAQEWGPAESGAGVLKTQSQGCPSWGSGSSCCLNVPTLGIELIALATEGKKQGSRR